MFIPLVRGAVFAASLALIAPLAHAEGGRTTDAPLLPKYQQECSACHIAYPPGMLPAESWKRLVNGLPQHFGTDASLDAQSVQQLSVWLAANAGTARRAGDAPPQDRITRSVWFVREHEEVPSSAWNLPAVKSPANCAACHTRANQGDFNEHRVRIPH
jgi:hypothetical protein